MEKQEKIKRGVDSLIDKCYSKELSACSLHTIFQRQKFLNELFPYLDSQGVVMKVNCHKCCGKGFISEEQILHGIPHHQMVMCEGCNGAGSIVEPLIKE